ncbi:MAG: DUF3617 family protein [Litoreibacter sp.]
MKFTVIYSILLILGLNGTAIAADRVIAVAPGLWEYTHTLEIPGLVVPTSSPKTECISPEEARRKLSDLLDELSGDAGCSVSNLKSTVSTVNFDLSCSPKLESISLQSTGHLSFRYGRTSITGKAAGKVSIGGAEIKVNAQAKARRIGHCKK